jgi:hypothetical protein
MLKKIVYSLASLCLLVLALASVGFVVETAFAQTACNYTINFDVQSPTGAGGYTTVTNASQDKVTLFMKTGVTGCQYDPTKVTTGFMVLKGAAIQNLGMGTQTLLRDASGTVIGEEYRLPYGVSGLPDWQSGNVVQPGGAIRFQAFLNAGSGLLKSSTIDLAFVPGTGGPGGSGGPGGTGGPGGGGPGGSGGPATTAVIDQVVTNPISYDSLGGLIVGLIRFLLTMIGALSVLFIIIGSVRMVTSAGNEKAVTAGKQTVTWAVIGLAVALLAFSFIGLLQSVLGRK